MPRNARHPLAAALPSLRRSAARRPEARHIQRLTPTALLASTFKIDVMMKKYLFTLLAAILAATTTLPMAAEARTAYAVEKDSTLTFYYDTQQDERGGTVYEVPTSEKQWATWNGTFSEPNITIKWVVFDTSFADFRPASTDLWFFYCTSLTAVKGIQNLNTSQVTNMFSMFDGCRSLQAFDASSLDTRNVTNMSSMFSSCHSLQELNLSGLDTRNVTSMSGMFLGCTSLRELDLTSFDTRNVTSMLYMFSGCDALQEIDVSNFDTGNVTDMSSMFSDCNALRALDLSGFNTANLTKTSEMFMNCKALKAIYSNSDWSQSGKVTESKDMFRGCTRLAGAMPYNDSQVDITMANPTKGYLRSIAQ